MCIRKSSDEHVIVIFQILLSCEGIEVDSADDSRITPLIIAIQFQHEKIVKMLIDAGANVNHEDIDGVSPFTIKKRH